MAKGFTVKAKNPPKKNAEQEWNYNEAWEIIKGKSVVFCMPGRGCSFVF